MTEESRQQRWHDTRAAFMAATRELITAQGFGATTMGQIARRAGMHVQTLYRHFPNKTALGATLYQDEFEQAIAERKTDALIFWRDWVHRSTLRRAESRPAKHPKGDRQRQHFRTGLPLEYSYEYIDILAQAIAEDFVLKSAASILPVLVANMLWGANSHAINVSSNEGDESRIDLVMSMLDEAITVSYRLLKEAGAPRASRNSGITRGRRQGRRK